MASYIHILIYKGESDDEDFCAVHLIDEGVVVEGNTASLFFKGTNAVSSYLCRLKGPKGVIGTGFQPCEFLYV